MTTKLDSKQDGRTQRRGALGKGFDSLLGIEPDRDEIIKGEGESGARGVRINSVIELNIDQLEPNPHQPRKLFDDEALQSLSSSVKVDGVLQPIIVAKTDRPTKYMIIAGERRWRASKLAGLEVVPVIVKEKAPEDLLRLALIENIQRADLSIIEEAEAYSSLIRDFGLTQDQCAQKVGKDRTTVTNALRILSLPRELHEDLMAGTLTMGHGRALLSLEDKKLILRARDIVVKRDLSVRQTEQLCRTFKKKGVLTDPSRRKGSETSPDLEYIADTLRNHLRTKVRISGSSQRGKIEVSFFSPQELERIISSLGVDL